MVSTTTTTTTVAPGQMLHYRPVTGATGNPKKLGQGAYGAVYEYVDTTIGECFAIKRIQLTGLPLNKAQLLQKFLPSELKNHYVLNHPHVVQLKDVFVTTNHLNIVLEMAQNGMLFEHVNKCLTENGGHMKEDDARWFFQQLVLTMEYFHKRNISHRDIKLENTLLKVRASCLLLSFCLFFPFCLWCYNPIQQDSTNCSRRSLGGPKLIIKVADFGLSKHDASITFTRVGTLDYMSPEVLRARPSDGSNMGQGYNGEKADIWSTGVMLYATLAGRYPFDTSIPEDARLEIMRERPLRGLPAHLSPACRALLEQMLHPDPEARITVAAIKQHPWFLQGLPPGAADMADHYIKAASPCRRTPQEVDAVIQQALQRLAAGTARAAVPAAAK